jgi:[protein-PII] uridylyltransferase
VSREFEGDDDEGGRAARIAETIEKALSGTLKLPEVVARRSAAKGRIRAFAVEPEVTINNQWSNRYTVIEVTGLDRPGLLYELTATLSKLNLNITSAHVATFGERVVDVFYVTDLLGAKIASPTRETAIKRALLSWPSWPSWQGPPSRQPPGRPRRPARNCRSASAPSRPDPASPLRPSSSSRHRQQS